MTGMHRMKVQYIRGPSEDSNLSLLSRHHTRSDSRSVDDFEEPAIEVVAPTTSSSSSSAMLSSSSSSLTASFDLSREEAEFLDLDPPSAQPPSGWRARRKNKKKRQEQIQQELQAPSSPQSSFRRKRSKSVPHSLYRAARGDDGDFGEPPTTTTTASNDVEQQISPSPRGLFARLRNLGRRGSKKKKKEVNPLDTTHRWVDNGLVKRSLLNPNAMEEFRTIPEEDIVIEEEGEEEEEEEKEEAKEEEEKEVEEKEKGEDGGKGDSTPDISTNDSTESLTTWLAKHIDIKPQSRSPPSTVQASPTAGTKKPSPKANHESLLMMHNNNKKKKTFLLADNDDDDEVSTTSQSSSSDEKPRAVIKLRRISRRMNSSPAPLPKPPESPPRPVFARSVSNPDFSLQPTKPSLKKQATVGSKSERPARRGLIKDDNNNTRSVSFSKIQIREYARTVGDNPCTLQNIFVACACKCLPH